MARLSGILQAALAAAAAVSPATAAEGGFASGRTRLTSPASDAASGRYIVELENSTGPSTRQDSSVGDSIVGQISSLGYEATVKEDFSTISGRFKGVSIEIANDDSSGIVGKVVNIIAPDIEALTGWGTNADKPDKAFIATRRVVR